MPTPQAPPGGFKQGGWYDGKQYWNGSFSSAGQIHPESSQVGAGKQVSDEVIGATKPSNVSFIKSQIQADKIQQAPQINYTSMNNVYGAVEGLQSSVDNARKSLDETLSARQKTIDDKLAVLKTKEQETLDKVGEITQPFREELEKTERERLHINENFEANQGLVTELDQLLTEGNELIRQQQEVTGLSAIRNPRIQKTMNDVAARAGVIQAVMSARNGQISVAENMIDRTINAIAQDKNDQLSYYETILNLNNRDILSLDTDAKKIAEDQVNLLKGDLSMAQATQDYVKQLLLDPASSAMMGKAGVTLSDSVEVINQKLSQAQYSQEVIDMNNEVTSKGGRPVMSPSGVPSNQLASFTDSQGKVHYYKMPKAAGSGDSQFANDFIAKTLGINSIFDDTVPIVTDEYAGILNIVDEVISPNFSPSAGIGSNYIDNLGRKWIFESSGWQLFG